MGRSLRQGLLALVFLSVLFPLNPTTLFGQVQSRIVETVNNARRVTLTGNVHPLARPEFDRGPVDDTLAMNRMLLLLKRSDAQESVLQDFMGRQQDKSSTSYHVWLTPQQFGAQYGPADSDVQTVTQWLGSQGFRVEKVYSGKTVVEFSGAADQVRTAFGTAIHNYQVNGKAFVANANDPQIPSALAPVVAGIVSLNNFPRLSHMRIVGHARKVSGIPGWQPDFTYPNPFGGTGNFYAMAPGDFATIYNSKSLISSGNDGTGQSIAIVGETNINASDVQAFRTLFGLPSTFASANIILNGEDPGITSVDEEGEADLDTQWAGAVAPGATVNLVVSASSSTTAGVDLSALYIIENNLAGVMSESYGYCETGLGVTGNAFYNSLWQQAAAQGISAVVSAGDNGSAGCDDRNVATTATAGLAVSGLASTPYNVAVGGTDFDEANNWTAYWSPTNATSGTDAIGTSALGYIPEIPWNQNCSQISLTACASPPTTDWLNIVAGSGGSSSLYAKPSWQLGINGMPNDGHRDLPDISFFASPGFDGTGYIVCQADAYANLPCSIVTPGGVNVQIVGGTSASTPAFAGVIALINQKQATAQNPAPRQGNANYVLYALAKKSGASCPSSTTEAAGCIFNDVTHGNSFVATKYGSSVGTNSVPCQGGSKNCSTSVSGAKGVLVNPNNASAEAWIAAAGYDLATGLGSVNIANLATNWANANTVSTTTTLSLAPTTNITHGLAENVSVNISVVPKSGTATGDVSLIAKFSDGTTQGLDQFTLSAGGGISATTDALPGGTNYQVYAHYAGDGTNAPSDSAPPLTVTVGPESSKTFANLVTSDMNGVPTSFSATAATYGEGYAVFRVDVGDLAASLSSTTGVTSNCSRRITNCPTGGVALNSTGAPLKTSLALNNSGYAETAPLPPGNYSVTASYPGDSSYNSSSGSASFAIAKAPTVVTTGVAGSPVQYGNSAQIDANVATTSTGAAPTGTFQFLIDGNAVGSAVPVYENGAYVAAGNPANYAWADAISRAAFTSVGNHTLSAQYSGDANYANATSAAAAVTVTQALPSFNSFGPNPGSINLGQQVTLTAQLSGSTSGAPPTGTFTFYDRTTTLTGTISYTPVVSTALTGSMLQATMPYTPTTVGSHNISVSYSGDTNYQAVTSGSAQLSVIGPDFTLTAQTLAATVVAGKSATYSVVVAGTNGFNSNVSVSCSLAAAATTCSAAPSSVSPGSSTTVTVTTTAHQIIPPSPFVKPLIPGVGTLSVSATIAFLLMLAYNARLLRRRKLAIMASLVLVILSTVIAAGCGGGGGSSGGGGTAPPPTFGTQPGSYTVTITATSPTVTHTTTVTLTVQ
jgi:hypothetical protein